MYLPEHVYRLMKHILDVTNGTLIAVTYRRPRGLDVYTALIIAPVCNAAITIAIIRSRPTRSITALIPCRKLKLPRKIGRYRVYVVRTTLNTMLDIHNALRGRHEYYPVPSS